MSYGYTLNSITKMTIMTPYACPRVSPTQNTAEWADIRTSTIESLRDDPNFHAYLNRMDMIQQRVITLQNNAGIPPVQDSNFNNIALFKDVLMQPSINIHQALPISNLESMELRELLIFILEQKIPGARGAFAIHFLVDMKKIDENEVLRTLFDDPGIRDKILLDRYRFLFIQLCYGLYRHKIVPQKELLKRIIDTFHPKCYEIFFKEIMSSFPVFNYAMTISKNKQAFTSHYNIKIFSCKTQMVQIATYHYLKDRNTFTSLMSNFSPDIIERISNVITTLEIQHPIQNFIMKKYPYENIYNLTMVMISVIQMNSTKDLRKIIIDICETIFIFNSSNQNQAVLLAESIARTKEQFPIPEYINLLKKYINKIKYAEHLSIELQERNLFTFEKFVSFLNFDDEIDVKIFLNTPCTNTNTNTLTNIFEKLNQFVPENNYGQIYQEYKNDKFTHNLNIDDPLSLPLVLRYSLFKDISLKSKNLQILEILIASNYYSLATDLLIRLNPTEITTNINPLQEILKFKLLESKSQLNVSDFMNRRKIKDNAFVDFMKKHSSYVSLFSYDALLHENSSSYYKEIIVHVLIDLVKFASNDINDICAFIWDFAFSNCVENSKEFIIKTFIEVLIENKDLTLSPRFMRKLYPILELLFEWRLLTPYILINRIVMIPCPEVESALMKALFKLIEQRSEIFSLTDFIDNNLINDVLQLEAQELSTLIDTVSKHLDQSIIAADFPDKNLQNTDITVNSATFASLVFSLLPDDIRCSSFQSIFEKFKTNVTWGNVEVWSLWISRIPLYRSEGRILVPTQPVNNNYYSDVVDSFMKLFFSPLFKENRDIYKYAWSLVCEEQRIASQAIDVVKSIITAEFFESEFSEFFTDFIIPPLRGNSSVSCERLLTKLKDIDVHKLDKKTQTIYIKTFVFTLLIYVKSDKELQTTDAPIRSYFDDLLPLINSSGDCMIIDAINRITSLQENLSPEIFNSIYNNKRDSYHSQFTSKQDSFSSITKIIPNQPIGYYKDATALPVYIHGQEILQDASQTIQYDVTSVNTNDAPNINEFYISDDEIF